MTVTANRLTQAGYIAHYRAEIKSVGFGHTSLYIHEDDRKLILAHAELMRNERMISMVLQGDENMIDLAVKRNRSKKRSKEEVGALRTLIEGNEGTKEQATGMLKAYTNYLKKASGYEHDLQVEPENDVKFALSILYNNLSGACYKYAEALATYNKPVM